MKHTYIYILIDPLTNQIRYVGKANNPQERYKNHKNRCRDKNTHKRNWMNKLRLKGLYPEIEIIDRVLTSEWHYWEKFWIAYYRFLGCSLVNYTSGGDGLTFGNQTSFKKGQVSWNKGKGYKQNCLECGIEFNIPISESKKRLCCNRKCSTIYRKKHNLYKGTFKKNHTTWNKEKNGYKLSGLKKANSVLQYSLNGDFIKEHLSCSDAAKELKCIPENIRKVCVGINKTAKNFIFKYKI